MTTFIDPTTGDPIITPCSKEDPELWYSFDVDDQRLAKRICGTCPAMKQCLEFAQDHEANHGHGYRHGIWAGMGPHERSQATDRRVA